MSRHDDFVSMRQMLDHAREIRRFSAGKSLDDLRNDRLLELALIRLLEVIGEAAARVKRETRDQYPEIPWSQIIGLRNRLIQAYDAVDMAIIWNIIVADTPQLIESIEGALRDGLS